MNHGYELTALIELERRKVGGDAATSCRRTPPHELVPLGDDDAVPTYNAGFQTGRGLNTTVIATSVWHRGANRMEDAVLPGH